MNIVSKSKKCKENTGWIYSPEGFDPSRYPGAISHSPDPTRWYLNYVYFKRITRHYGPEDFVNVSYDALETVMGKRTIIKPIKDELLKHKLIETDSRYIPGTKSTGYRLGPALRDVPFKKYFSASKRFLKRVADFKKHINTPIGFSLPVHEHLDRWLADITIAPIWESVLHSMDPDKALIAQQQVELIQSGYLHRSVCKQGRFHSNFSSLCRELRPCLQYQGQPLLEIDIRNSQPYFLSMLLLSVKLSNSNSSNLKNLMFDSMHSSIINLEETGRERERRRGRPYECPFWALEKDHVKFTNAVINGKFYEEFLQEVDNEREREDMKPKVFQCIFGDEKTMIHSTMGRMFKDRYPSVFNMIMELKSKKGYRWVGQELQRMESERVVAGVCGRLMTEHPTIPLISVHDAIMTTKEYMPLVQGLLKQELSFAYYFVPQMKIKGQQPIALESPRSPTMALQFNIRPEGPTGTIDAPEPS